jgi:hypothetical protein
MSTIAQTPSTIEQLLSAGEPAPFDGYADWSDSLSLEQPAGEPAVAMTAAEFEALIAEPAPVPPAPAATAREQRGRALAEARAVRLVGANVFAVAGSDGEVYHLSPAGGGRMLCECGDYVFRIERALDEGAEPVDRACKHGYAVEHALRSGSIVGAGRVAA